VARFPGAIISEFQSNGWSKALLTVLELVVLFLIVMFAIMLTQAVRRVQIQYARQVVGNRSPIDTGERQYLPLKLNTPGVMPIIFAQALMFLPSLIAGAFAEKSDVAQRIATTFGDFTSLPYNLLYAVLIIVFTFFYTAISVNPSQIADDMKRGGGFAPGIKPGEDTTNFIATILDRITLPGAVMLASLAILPAIASLFGVKQQFALFFGGTSLLILVGVVLDTLSQIEGYLVSKKYDGLMQSGRVRGRSES
jgi:preprotein translocase subunit SecY